PDLWLDTCGCCAIESGTPGLLYSFAAGLASPIKLGSPPARGHCNSNSNTVSDFDGDGTLEMISMGDATAALSRADGTVLATTTAVPTHASSAFCEAADIAGKPGDEVICLANGVDASGGQRGLFALTYRPKDPTPLQQLWSMTASAADGDARGG